MANSFTQIYLHIVFSVAYRNALISDKFKDDLYKYISGGIKNQGHHVIAIGGTADHIHILIRYNVTQNLPQLIQSLKVQSTKWINENKLSRFRFAWQNGYGAFSYSQSQVDVVTNYILNQKEHHKKVSFIEEYRKLLDLYHIDFNSNYIFCEPE